MVAAVIGFETLAIRNRVLAVTISRVIGLAYPKERVAITLPDRATARDSPGTDHCCMNGITRALTASACGLSAAACSQMVVNPAEEPTAYPLTSASRNP